MSTKTLTVTDEAYNRLAAQKQAKESFSDVINRLAGKGSVLELAGILSKTEAEELSKTILKQRKLSTSRIARLRI